MIALEWGDVDLAKRQLCVRRSDWNGQVGTPKGGRQRYVPLTRRLTAALAEHRHLRSKRVFCQDDRTPFTRQIVQNRMILAARRANVRRGVHILRHYSASPTMPSDVDTSHGEAEIAAQERDGIGQVLGIVWSATGC
jgi:integrase